MSGSTIVGELVDAGLAELQTGPFGTELKASEYVPFGIPVINVRNIGFGNIRVEKLEHVDAETAERLRQHRLRAADVVFGRKGAVERHAFLREEHEGWMQGSDCIRLRFKGGPLLPRFVSYFFSTPAHQQWMMNQCSHGATMASLNQDILRRIEIDLPNKSVQRKIAAVLAAYDELIENNLRRIEILEEMAQAVYREWFVNFRFPGHEDTALVDSPLGPIPEGWKVVEMSSFTKTQYGFTASTDEKPVGPKFLRGMDFNKRPWIDWSEVPYCPIKDAAFAKYCVHTGDVLVIRMADPGKVAIIEKAVDAVFASYVVRVAPDYARALPYWLFYYMSSPDYQGYISGAGTGTTRKSASAGVLTGSKLALPPIAVQEQFVAVVSPLRQLLNNLLDQNANLRSTRDLLLPKLVSGGIDVSDLDIDTEWLAS